MLSAEEADTLQTLELFAVVWAISHFREPINVVTDSLYVAGVVAQIEDAFIKEVRNQRLYQLLMQLNKALHQREQPYAVIHIRSHKWNIGLGEGNQRADELVSTAITVPLPQHVLAQEAHSIFHQNAKGLQKEFHISHAEATAIVRSCPICCHHNGGLGLGTGVNPRGVKANELWQTDVTHVNSFGRLKYVHVTIDTYSHYIWATPQSGWTAWLRKWNSFKKRTLRDITDVMGTGLGILNNIDSEVILDKLAATTRDLTKLQQSLVIVLRFGNTSVVVIKHITKLGKVCSFSGIWAEISRGADETPDPGRGNPERCGEWEDMGQLLKEFSDPVVWDFPREQIQNPVELEKYLKESKPKPLAVALVKKHRVKTDRPVDNDDPREGPSPKSEAKASSTGSEANIDSFSLKDLRGLRKDYRRQPDESIISWLVRLWGAAGEATILDGTEVRHLGSLSHDPVIDQEMMREASSCSLWIRVLGSVAERYLCADDLYMQQTPWKTIEQGIQRLREMAVAEMVFSDDINTRNPDLVSCTSVMWQKLIRLGPLEYASALAVMKQEDMEETVLDIAKKFRAYADAVHGPTHARIAAVETCLQKLEEKIDENHKKLREEIREDLLQISAVQIRGSGTQRRRSPARERGYTPRAELWFFLRDCRENMNRWDGKSTAALAQWVRELKEVKTQRGSSTKREAAPVSHSRTARYDDDDMSNPLEGTSKTYAQGKKDNQA
ncbi:hypothetical protein DUI87_26307 [Hirundo rustica rustica]|uniref:RNA-directed DNA polymerase n=1 Tax=Hirundo rustica rustica TaxID=333673 RepID=A0A3M0J8D9_HIRRU|nr:hypothetical protein DUI87_26307 [Hirundo rustica rustica]